MRLSRRRVLATAAATAATLRTARAAERIPLTYWYGPANSDGQAALQKHVVDGFNASQDKYQLSIEVKGAAINNALRVALLAGSGPDLVQTSGPTYLTPMATAGQVLPLDDLAKKYGWDQRFLPALLNTGV